MLDNRPPEPDDSSSSFGSLLVGMWFCSSFFDILEIVLLLLGTEYGYSLCSRKFDRIQAGCDSGVKIRPRTGAEG